MSYKIISFSGDKLIQNINRLLNAYEISCCGFLLNQGIYTYYLKDKTTGTVVSGNLTLIKFNNTILVEYFHPKLNSPENPNQQNKGLSVALFYLLVAHCANNENLPQGTKVNLDSRKEIFSRFYSKIFGFDFNLGLISSGNNYCVSGILFNFDPRGDYSSYIKIDDDILPNSHLLQRAHSK